MCCFVLVLGFLGPRIAFVWLWIAETARVNAAFGGTIIWPLLGVLFLPWTSLAWLAAYAIPGGVTGVGWLVVGLGLLFDIASYSGRAAQQRYQPSAA